MHTVSLFPAFFDYQMLGVFLLRVTLGFIFVRFWYEHSTRGHHNKKYLNVIYPLLGISGALIIVGLYTQGAVIVTGTIMTVAAFMRWRKPSVLPHDTPSFYILLAVASFALLFLGAGAFAIDLPL
ncbi:MAG: hypothetical protein WC791_03865 [Candidatus Paceibacterota bacterium]|jgi:hypothetical protein